MMPTAEAAVLVGVGARQVPEKPSVAGGLGQRRETAEPNPMPLGEVCHRYPSQQRQWGSLEVGSHLRWTAVASRPRFSSVPNEEFLAWFFLLLVLSFPPPI